MQELSEVVSNDMSDWIEIGKMAAAVGAGFLLGIPVILASIRKLKCKRKSKEECFSASFYRIHSKVHECLTELRVITDCARAQIVQFHNGGQFFDGVSMKKFTLTHESLVRGIAGEGTTKKDLLLSMYIPLLTELKENSPHLRLVSNHELSYSKQVLETNNCISYMILPIRNGGLITGMVMCQWCSWGKTDSVDEQIISASILRARDTIEVLIKQEEKAGK